MDTTIAIESLGDSGATLSLSLDRGEHVVITREGQPIAEVVPKALKVGIDWEAIERFKRERGIARIVTRIARDFDDPLPEDFLLQALPDPIDRPNWP